MKNNFQLEKDITKSLELLGYNNPTEVQKKVIPLVLDNKDVIVKSKTGSGKTASFAIPICNNIDWDENAIQALILSPTRELAMQIQEEVFNIGRFKKIKTTALFGKDSFSRQVKELKQKMHVVVATPGRLSDHIERGTIDLSNIKYLVIDEADEMLAMGFIEQVEQIISMLPSNRTNVLLSATMSTRMVDLSSNYMNNPTLIEIKDKEVSFDHIKKEFYQVNMNNKLKLLDDLCKINNPDSCIVFCNTQVEVDAVESFLEDNKYSSNKLHGGMEQEDRTYVMKQFKKGLFRYLVATDVAARGIDIDDISLVINYDIPNKAETFVHRIGRTGRIGKSGIAISLVPSQGCKSLEDIEKAIRSKIVYCNYPTNDQVLDACDDFYNKMEKSIEIKNKANKLNEGILKLHINAGKKTKMRPLDIVGTLCSIEGITNDDIGIITVQDISTYVEILNGKGKFVLAALQDKPIKGRNRKVSIANNRD